MKNTVTSLLVILFTTFFQNANGQNARQKSERKPKLVVGLVIDQMRWDYLQRFSDQFGEGGFKRLVKDGFSFENAFISYAPTVTAAGHASIYTGTYPSIHGIVGNEWVNRQNGLYSYCTDDSTVQSLGGSNAYGRMSPNNLLATTVGDELKLARDFKSRVFGISLKDRGGIFPAGRSGDAAYWLDDSTGNWTTSTWYMKSLPRWVNRFNKQRKIDAMMREGWRLSLPAESYNFVRPDANEFEIPITNNNSTSFPHELKEYINKSYTPFRYTPMGNTLTLDFARLLVEEEVLGTRGETDMLCVSLSSPDYIGHKFGPLSLEIEDTYLRLDKEIASFLTFLDGRIGEGNYLLFLTADHGAPAIPDFLKSKKLSAGNLDNYALVKEIDQHLAEKFGKQHLITHYFNNQFFLNRKRIDSLRFRLEDVIKAVENYLNGREEVVMAFDYSKLNEVVLPNEVKEKIARGYFPKRCGDVYVILKPQYVDYLGKETEHGTFYNYDSHIPMLFFGQGIKAGNSHRRVWVTDIAPTLSALLRIQMPNGSMGEVLLEVMKDVN